MDQEILNATIILHELENAVASFPNSMEPGVDCLPLEIYKKYREVLLPTLLSTFDESFSMGRLPYSIGKAAIILIPKKDKDLLYPESYRLISLLPTDAKILAKVLANRLKNVITHIIHLDQGGFMPKKVVSREDL